MKMDCTVAISKIKKILDNTDKCVVLDPIATDSFSNIYRLTKLEEQRFEEFRNIHKSQDCDVMIKFHESNGLFRDVEVYCVGCGISRIITDIDKI